MVHGPSPHVSHVERKWLVRMAVILERTSAAHGEGGAAGMIAWLGLVRATLQISKHDTVPEHQQT